MPPDTLYLTDIFDFTLDMTLALRIQQVRRLALEPDADELVQVVRLTLPDFELNPVTTTLVRDGENTYHCLETMDFDLYERTFTVDDPGFVLDQEGGWTHTCEIGGHAARD